MASLTIVYWRRYDFSKLRLCFDIVILLLMAVIYCFVLQKCWRAIIKMVEQKSAGIFLILTFGRKMSAGVGLIPAQRRNPRRFFGSFPDYRYFCRNKGVFCSLLWMIQDKR